ncbi:hypothetical protein CFBP6411_00144 [Pseudomonas syringae group genomosp. 3]|uniref:Relaxase n=1 Tax=Pseudomonas syringae group genomosp. 3 TaxID=251701 RepID=A0A2K4W6K1_9PSED|nr:hypothetical protein [Pseudomonas syringae group genomosp. 3]SOS31514.1 hypothetical protein CFBP6411_00144 [Pseudomonas syringae group genomosp. 3]
MKRITILKRDINYDSISGLSSSLEHSLRIRENDLDNVMYNEELKNNNKAFYSNEIKTIGSDIESRIILSEILEKISDESASNTKTVEEKQNAKNLKSYKNKLKNFYSNTPDDVKDYVLTTMENFKNFDENTYREFLTAQNINSKSVKNQTTLMKNFCNASIIYEASSQKINTYNANQVKEVILVIPRKNDIEVSEYTNNFLLKTAVEFYKENHPDNEILIGFSHSDETTNHCHLFINLRNSRNNSYDFVEQETLLSEKNQSLAVREKPQLEDFKTPKRKDTTAKKLLLNEEAKWRGETLQRLFYKHFNEASVKHKMEFEATFNVKDASNEEAYRFMDEQSKLPKNKRQLNMLHLQNEEIKREIAISSLTLAKQKENAIKATNTRKENDSVLEKQKLHHSKTKQELTDLKSQVGQYQEEERKKKNEIAALKENLQTLKREEATYKESIKTFTKEYFTKIFSEMRTLYEQVLGLKPLYDTNLKRFGLGKVFLKNDLLDETEFDNRVKDIVRDKSTASIELYNSIDRHYTKADKEFEARTKKWTQQEVTHRKEKGMTSENEYTLYLNRNAPVSKAGNNNAHLNTLNNK